MKQSDTKTQIMGGTWAWGTGRNGSGMIYGKNYPDQQLEETFDTAYKLGYIMWDTAEVYGMGEAERILGKCMTSKENVFVSTKHRPEKRYRTGEVTESIEKSLTRLGRVCVDLYWLHTPENLEENLSEMAHLAKQGKIKHIGISNCNITQLKQAVAILKKHDMQLYAVQNHFSLLAMERQKDVFTYCMQNEIKFFGYMLLEQGALSGKYDAEHPFPFFSMRGLMFGKSKFKKIQKLLDYEKILAKQYQIDQAQIPIIWAIQKGVTPIVGLTKPEHVLSLETGKDVRLTNDEIDRLEQYARSCKVTCKGTWE